MPAYSTLPPPPSLGQCVPDRPHAVSVHLPKWRDVVDFSAGEARVRTAQKGGYPRSFLHAAIAQAHAVLVHKFGADKQACLLFPTRGYAAACEAYLCAPPDGSAGVPEQHVAVRSFAFDVARAGTMTLHAVFFPADEAKNAMIFWRLTGCGISSRLAQDMLPGLDSVSVAAPDDTPLPRNEEAEMEIQQRIASLLDRAPVGGPRKKLVSPDDVFLYPTGMSAIYNCTNALNSLPGSQMVVFGFPYELTLKVQEDFATACTFYGFGTDDELDQFEHLLVSKAAGSSEPPIQAVWCECASNPLLRTVDLDRIRRLADRYGFVVVVDDTIGSAANVDVLGVADIVATSLTKTFSGYADVMGGSLALNPSSAHHAQLRQLLGGGFAPTLYGADAAQLARNSRDYLARTAVLNQNASYLVSLLAPLTRHHHARSPLAHVYHPSTCWSAGNYAARMRAPTAGFAPGFGYLLTLEFCSVEAAAAFFDALHVCKGPSIGAHVTLALPYVQVVFAREKPWAARYGLSEAIVRISVGLEDQKALAMACLEAMRAADAVVNREEDDDAAVHVGPGLHAVSLPPPATLVPQML
ncbi:Cys Met pyridoxal phosphate-dependent enzyme [Cordyceps militaris]|uniref:Cys Met pyridoxal phosphate-dependent enzyme n=1 Tax=Cordyceps militaris TaxID=73501 RepID=A0A2H4SGV0_CORMI|nr:Cys Met pyridoxal phosphate-dependent enzyme [Cordyceps militaris]